MGLNLKRVGTAIGTGGLSEVYNALKPGQQTINQQVMETPEQRAARLRLSNFSSTGTYDFGNGKSFTAGTGYGGDLGDFSMTPTEQAAQSRLSTLLASGRPDIYSAGEKTLTNLLSGDQFDPYSATGEFAPFKDAVLKETAAASGRAKNAAAFSGNLYSSNTGKNLTNLQGDANNQLMSKLAQLFSNYTNQKISAIPQALNYAATGQALDMAPIEAGYQYGGLSRNLNTAQDQAKYQEFQRQRQELQLPIQTAGTLAGTNPQFGVPSITTQTPSPWMDLLKLAVQGGAAYMGAKG